MTVSFCFQNELYKFYSYSISPVYLYTYTTSGIQALIWRVLELARTCVDVLSGGRWWRLTLPQCLISGW